VIEKQSEKARLLVLSDNPAILGRLSLAGELNQWRVDSAADAWDAMEKAQLCAALDLFVLDQAKGHGDGSKILRILRRMWPNLPIVLICHSTDISDRNEALAIGACDYLPHPLADGQLECVIQNHLSKVACGSDAKPASADMIIASVPQLRCAIFGYKSLRSLLQSVKEEAERNAIALALQKTAWNRKAAARLLKTSYRTILYKIDQYQMSSSVAASNPATSNLESEDKESRRNGYRDAYLPESQ
jgi:DNA-binding NtrC family response regulator